jgi:hypothetical protein
MREHSKYPPPNVVGPWWWLGLANRPGSRGLRRRLVIATWVVWLAFALYAKIQLNPGGWLLMWVPTGIAMLLWLGSRRYVDTPSLADGELDERLKQVGTSAMASAYRIFTPVAIFAWALSLGVTSLQPNQSGRETAEMIWVAAFLLGATLPTMIVAWREPDPVSAEQLPA